MSRRWFAWVAVVLIASGCDSATAPAADSQVIGDAVTPNAAPPGGPDSAVPVPDAVDDVGVPDSAPTPQLQAGAASVDVTPTGKGVPLGGFGGAPRRKFTLVNIPAHLAAVTGNCYDPTPGDVASLFEPSQGKLDSLTAKALVLSNGTTKAAIIKIDAIGVDRAMRDELEQTAKTLGIPAGNLIVTATHTHSGPGAVGHHALFTLIAMDCLHDPTYKAMLAGVTKALTQADAALQPARVGIGSVEEKNVSNNRMGRPGVFDPTLGLIKVVEAKTDKPIAALMNYAVHGTCLGASNMLFSADLMGYAERDLEKKLGGVALFVNGTEGDVSPKQGGLAGAAALGAILADTTSKLWQKLPTKTWFEIEGKIEDVKMPKAVGKGCLELFGDGKTLCDYVPGLTLPIDAFMQKELPFGALRLDDVVIATIPGEAITDIGQEIKKAGKARGFRLTLLFGLANDHMGYVVTKDLYDKDEYESNSTMYGPTTGQVVVDSATKVVDAVKVGSPSP